MTKEQEIHLNELKDKVLDVIGNEKPSTVVKLLISLLLSLIKITDEDGKKHLFEKIMAVMLAQYKKLSEK